MKGTAILYKEEQNMILLEDIEKTIYEEIKKQCCCDHCKCDLGNSKVDFGYVSQILWHDEEIDWDYGY